MNTYLVGVRRRTPPTVVRAAKSGLRSYGVATGPLRAMPDFLILGTKRGGTTSLWNYVLAHPHVLPLFPAQEKIKSPHYFDHNYGRGDNWYRSHFATKTRVALMQRRTGIRPLVGEASPYYMFYPHTAARVRETLPAAKLIVMLRDPVKRAYSHYQERLQNGMEPLPFAEAIQAEDDRLAGEYRRIAADPGYYSLAHDSWSYLARGRYLEQLQPWLNLFDRRQLLVLRSEDLYSDPNAFYGKVTGFLGLPHVALQSARRHNYRPAAPMDPAVKEWLTGYYRPYNAQLEAALGMSFDWDPAE